MVCPWDSDPYGTKLTTPFTQNTIELREEKITRFWPCSSRYFQCVVFSAQRHTHDNVFWVRLTLVASRRGALCGGDIEVQHYVCQWFQPSPLALVSIIILQLVRKVIITFFSSCFTSVNAQRFLMMSRGCHFGFDNCIYGSHIFWFGRVYCNELIVYIWCL